MSEVEVARCTATRTNGEACKLPPIKGGTVCRVHGGSAPGVRLAANRRLLQVKVQGELEALGWEKVTDPLAAYADLAGELVAFKELAREKVNELTEWSYVDQIGREDAKAVIGVYERALAQCDKILSSMIRLGLDHEALRQARERPSREQAATLIEVIGRVLADPRVTVVGNAQAIVLDALGDLAPGGA